MKLIIDIPEEDYAQLDKWSVYYFREIIAKGTPLPKGHGRLIDGSKLEQFTQLPDMTFELLAIDIFEAPTIVEEDKENKE